MASNGKGRLTLPVKTLRATKYETVRDALALEPRKQTDTKAKDKAVVDAIAAADKPELVELIPLVINHFQITVKGISPLICHRFTEKARRQIEDKQQKKSKGPKEARDPEQEYLDAFYVYPDDIPGTKNCRYGIKAVWFKRAAVDACRFVDGMKMTLVRGAFHVLADPESGREQLIRLNYKSVSRRDEPVKIGIDTLDMRYRPEFQDWSATMTIQYMKGVIRPDQIINLINRSGFGGGVGERRPSQTCSDRYGMFQVEPGLFEVEG